MVGVVLNTRFQMEDLASVTQMPMQIRKAHVVPLVAGVETLLHTAHAPDAQTSG